MRKIFSLILVLTGFVSFGQLNKPKIEFLADSVMLGESVELALTYRHSKDLEVLFPDSNFNYKPFEYVGKRLFPTITRDSVSLDCTIYVFQTFELDKKQGMQLNVTLYSTKDSFRVVSNSDSILLKEVIQQMPDSVKLMTNTEFSNVETQFNYPYFLIFMAILGVIALIVLVGFGKGILRRIRIYRLSKKHETFLSEFNALIKVYERNENVKDLEQIVLRWKKHLGVIEKMELVSRTSREIKELFKNVEIDDLLSDTDRVIFGGKTIEKLPTRLSKFIEFADVRLQHRIEEIKDAGRK